jgi:cytochrome P450
MFFFLEFTYCEKTTISPFLTNMGLSLANIGWGFFPFSGGPRQCLGEDFAQMEVSYTIVRNFASFSA